MSIQKAGESAGPLVGPMVWVWLKQSIDLNPVALECLLSAMNSLTWHKYLCFK
jgi:hypothetical protein